MSESAPVSQSLRPSRRPHPCSQDTWCSLMLFEVASHGIAAEMPVWRSRQVEGCFPGVSMITRLTVSNVQSLLCFQMSPATQQMQPTQTLQSPPPSGGRRRRVVDEDPDERRRKFLERNRAAATRCRQKRKVWVMSLEKKAEELTQTNMQLQVRDALYVFRHCHALQTYPLYPYMAQNSKPCVCDSLSEKNTYPIFTVAPKVKIWQHFTKIQEHFTDEVSKAWPHFKKPHILPFHFSEMLLCYQKPCVSGRLCTVHEGQWKDNVNTTIQLTFYFSSPKS